MMIIKQSSGILVLHSDNESNAKKIHHSQSTELTVYFNMIVVWFPLTLNHEYYKMLLRLRNLFLRKKRKRFDPMQYVALKKLFWLHIMSTRVWIYSWCCLQLLNERKKKEFMVSEHLKLWDHQFNFNSVKRFNDNCKMLLCFRA